MISAVASKLKSIIGANTHGTNNRKRTLENSEGSPEVEEPMMEEPSRKRARTADIDDCVTRFPGHSTWKLGNIPRFMSTKASHVITWFTSFTLPTTSIDEHPDAMLPVVRRKLREDRHQTEQVASNYGSDRRHSGQGPAMLYSAPRGQEDEEEIQYLGMKSRLERNTPTRRPALSRHTEAAWSKSSKLGTPNISGSFRFSPSVSSTAAKVSQQTSNRKHAAKESSLFSSSKASKLNSINRKSMSISRHLPMDFNEKIFGQKKKKGIFNFSSAKANAYQFEDKMRYRQLLQQFTDSSVLPDSHSVYRGLSTSSSNSISRCESLQGLVTKSSMDSNWTNDKRQEIESSTPVTITSPTQRSAINDLKQKINGIREGRKSSRHVPLIDLVQPESEDSNQSLKDSDTDSVIFTNEIKKTEPKTNSLEERLQANPMYDKEWLKSIRERYELKGKTKVTEAEKATKMKQLLEEKRKALVLSPQDTVELKMKDLDLTFPSKVQEITLDDEEEEEELVPLTEEMEDIIDDALRRNPPGQVLIDKFNIQITRRDIATLHGLNWLNDEVINFYMNLLMERGKNDNCLSVYAFNTFFYPKLVKTGYGTVRRWTKKVDIFSQDLLLVPVHLGMHWCLATLDFRSKKIRYYDSMLGDNERCLEALLKYLESEHEDKKKSKYSSTSEWTLENVKNIPQQMNGSDCGMFACKFAEYLSRDAAITFDQEHMPYFRRRMIYEIVNSQLL